MRVEVTFDAGGGYAVAYKGGIIAPGPGPLPAPPVLFLASLAACAGAFAVDYLRTRSLPFTGLKVVAEATHAEAPRRLADLSIQVLLPAPVAERHMAPLQRAVDLCTLKNTLESAPVLKAQVVAPVSAR